MKFTIPIRFNYEFVRVYKRGRYLPGRYCVLHFMKNNKSVNRLGITTARNVRGSVYRNRIRRLMREVYRLNEENLRPGYDIVLLGRTNKSDIGFDKVEQDIVYLMKKANIWSADHK